MSRTFPTVVFAGAADDAAALAHSSQWPVFDAAHYRHALAQVLFSYPDVIVIDAGENMLEAENTFFHLRSIQHPPIVILSDMPDRWDRSGREQVVVLPENSTPDEIVQHIRGLLTGDLKQIS